MSSAPNRDGRAHSPIHLPTALRRLRERLRGAEEARALAPVRPPQRSPLPAPRRGWFAGWWSARIAAGSGVGLEEFLRHRLARYLSALPVPPDRLPVAIAIEEGGVVSAAPRDGAAHAQPSWLEGYLRAHGASAVSSDVLLGQGELARLATRIHEQHVRVEAARREAEAAAREPSIAEVDGGSVEGLGRPAVPPPWTAAIQLFGFALLLAEAYQLAMPVLAAARVDTGALAAELARNPAAVVLGSVFAVGAAVSLFYFVDLALRQALRLFAALPERSRALWTAAAAVAALAFAAAVSWSIAGLRPGADRVDLQYARFTLFLLALALPVTTSCLLEVGRRLHAARAEALAAAVAWDQLHYRALSEWSRRAAALAAEERELARLEGERAAATRRLRLLRERSQQAERLAAAAADDERLELDQLCHAITSALELDRYEFLRQAGAGAVPAPQPRDGRSLGLAG